jgi:methylated-DNA-[protein]-cysteine S-methyltransferase
MTYFKIIESPLGPLRLVCDDMAMLRIEFPDRHGTEGKPENNKLLQRCERQLCEYFAGKRREFNLPLAAKGTEFQHRVWDALRNIPFGELRSYRDIANDIGNRKAVRAVGAANGKNPIPIVVPCHRVIGSDGSLTGFAGGLAAKQLLLRLESPQRDISAAEN